MSRLSKVHERRCCRSFTLIEMVLASAISALLVGVMASSLTLMARAIDDGNNPQSRQIAAASALDIVTADLRVALAFIERGPKAIEFSVPDRTKDGSEDWIRYEWSGVAGDPLTRYVNGKPTTLIDDVHAFDLTYLLRAPYPETTIAEGVLLQHDAALLASRNTLFVTAAQSVGVYVRPPIDADQTEWAITRLYVRARSEGPATGVTRVAVVEADGNLQPTGTVLAETQVFESTLGGSYQALEIPLPVSGLSPKSGVCVIFERVSGNESMALQHEQGLLANMSRRTHLMTRPGGSGIAWTKPDDQLDLRFTLYGTKTIGAGCR
ncbi:MAG: prepilin-type N-terminal cleavage/methylation domain-containing protein [Phycisphaerales bacterium]|nr:prepilin-type N-terminal cleavage/methylation domain-containing protein [Phycisphaerales bacterium]